MKESDIQELINRVGALEKRVAAIEGVPVVSLVERKGQSIKEFVLAKGPTSDVERGLVIGFYLEKFEGFKSFNTKDLATGFRRAKEKVPGNMADVVQKNVGKGYMDLAKEKKDDLKAYYLTNSGEGTVERMTGATSEIG